MLVPNQFIYTQLLWLEINNINHKRFPRFGKPNKNQSPWVSIDHKLKYLLQPTPPPARFHGRQVAYAPQSPVTCIAVASQKRAIDSEISFLLKLCHVASSPLTHHSISGFSQLSCHVQTFSKLTFLTAGYTQFAPCRKSPDVHRQAQRTYSGSWEGPVMETSS